MRLHFGYFLACTLAVSSVAASQDDQIVFSSTDTMLDSTVFHPVQHSHPSLFDLLTIDPSLSIFFSYARETEASKLFADEDARTTVLVPTNKAVMALARKPHEGPARLEDDMEITEKDRDETFKRNVERWITSHIIPQSPIQLSSRSYPTLLHGKSVKFTSISDDANSPDWHRVVLDDGIHITGKKTASNGVLYIIDAAVSVSES